MSKQPPPVPSKPTLWQVIGSALAAAFGVQSNQNRERDFQAGSPKAYLIVGIVGTILFVATLYVIVKLVLALAGV
jgi:hypothetical protein